MRQEILSQLKKIKSVSYKVSEELPFSQSGIVLYLKNIKRIYVDDIESMTEQLIPVLNGIDVESEITTIRIYLSNDAKQQPIDYQQLVRDIKLIKDIIVGDYFKRECVISTSYNNDIMITTIEFKFKSIYKD